MRRRQFAATVVVLIAGCGGDGGSGGAGGADGSDRSAPSGDGSRGSPTPTFEPTVEFPTCTSVTVDADSYTAVALSLTDDSVEQFDGPFEGEQRFESDVPIREAVVWSEAGIHNAPNADVADCVGTDAD